MGKLLTRIISVVIVFSVVFRLSTINTINAEEQIENNKEVFADLAFPTAEGFGRFANEFRGGKVVAVTNLNPEGEGSLRWALEEVTGPRIVVFKVGGVIDLENWPPVEIRDENVYLAGQTAPGDGITIVGGTLNIARTNSVVIRNMRIRTGSTEGTSENSCLQIFKSEDIIIDHCSFSWGACYSVKISDSKNITIQNSILAESVAYRGNSEYLGYAYTSGCGVDLDVENCSIQRNLLTNNHSKVWAFSFDQWSRNDDNNNIDIRNNVVYNWHNEISGDESKCTQFVNNYYKKGKTTENDVLLNVNGLGYVSGNKLVNQSGEIIIDHDNENPWILVSDDSFTEGRSTEPLFDAGVNTLTADEAYEYVLKNSGAVVPKRDYIDSRYVSEVENGTHTYSSYGTPGVIYSEEDAEGYPDNTTFKGGEAPLDTDNDGMPDEWEVEHGLNPENYYDACQVYLSDEGYTNIELYINELAGDPVKYSDNPTIQYTPATPTPEPTATPEITATPEVTTTPVVTETISPTVTPENVDYQSGDVNGDGKVNAEDALLVLKHAAKIDYITENRLIIADVDKSKKIDAVDALAILKIAAKIY